MVAVTGLQAPGPLVGGIEVGGTPVGGTPVGGSAGTDEAKPEQPPSAETEKQAADRADYGEIKITSKRTPD